MSGVATYIYTAVHDETGETLSGSADALAGSLCVVKSTIYKMSLQGKKVAGHWTIKKMGKMPEEVHKRKNMQELLLEWDEVTKPFKKAEIRKKASGKGHHAERETIAGIRFAAVETKKI